ncbi:MAG: amino acid adenylation domain-containing protein [Chloroflexota bacterium]
MHQDSWQQSNLSASQLNLWLGQQRYPDAPIYNMVHTFTIHGAVDVSRFETAFQLLVEQCDSLRMVIDEVEGIPQQRVLDTPHCAVEFLDLSHGSQHDLQAWIAERSKRMLDLTTCAYDVVLIKLDPTCYIWYYNHHHLTCDMLSIELVYRYLSEIYTSLEAQDSIHITSGESGSHSDNNLVGGYAEIPSFLEVVVREQSQSPHEKARTFWREKLKDAVEPTDFYGHSTSSAGPKTERVRCELGPKRSAALNTLTDEQGIRAITPQLSRMNIFTAILATTLHRIGGANRERTNQVAIGTPFHNRPTPVGKRTPGLFIQLYPLLIDFDPGETFRTLIPKVMKESLSSVRYAPYVTQNLEQAASFDVVCNYLTAHFGDFSGMPTEFEWVHSGYGDANHALRLQIHDFQDSGEFVLYFDVNEGVFSQQAQERLIRHFLMVLDAFLLNPDAEIGQVCLLTPEEEQAFLVAFNETNAAYPYNKRVVDLFTAQAIQTPNQVAVVDGERVLTYAELIQRTDEFAIQLGGYGIGPNILVGLCTHRSLETIIAILAIHKAGGAYVPIDPAYPPGRINQILEEIHTPIILTQPALVHQFEHSQTPVLTYDRDTSSWTKWGEETQTSSAKRQASSINQQTSTAYVIFTSGSTGRPKGTLISQQSLTNYVYWAAKSYADNQPLAFPLFSSLAFDLTVTSIFVPLICGGQIVVYGEEEGVNDLAVLRVLQENVVDIIKLTPAHLSLVNEMKLAPSRLRKMIVGGEDFKTHLALQTLQLFGGDLEIYNEYGPTEATVGCMIHRFDPSRDVYTSVPIGTPANNAEIYVVDSYGNPVPTGVIGEMIITGHGIANGYLNRPGLTKEKFARLNEHRLRINHKRPTACTNHQSQQASDSQPSISDRQYRTGDLARWRSNGQLEFLGRADHQIKLRGYRVELGEIESTLLAHPQVQECLVTLSVPDSVEPTAKAQFLSSHEEEIVHCAQCGLPSNYPQAQLDEEGICLLCRGYERYSDKVQQYFRSTDELRQVVGEMRANRRGEYDCIMLMSGGKDSTYVLCQLVELGLKPLAFTLDNGYISEQAKANIRRVVDHLGVDHLFGTTPHMADIFVDSLKRYCNVCNGCFKTIYTLSMQLAHERGINYIVTGLARGQLFETRLTEELFLVPTFDVDRIDQQILDARKAYHRQQDLIAERLSGNLFIHDEIFEQIQFIDFYRYTDVSLDEMLAYLAGKVPWVRPADTGRSTNCLINDVGIQVHKEQRGYHNYALPYSWDVRLGHKEREAALDELDDEIDEAEVARILAEIGYDLPQDAAQSYSKEPQLVAYFVGDSSLSADVLRETLSESLPVYMMPSSFIPLEQMPLTINGKVDRAQLPMPETDRRAQVFAPTPPETELEAELAMIWQEILNRTITSIHATFFELGGTSLPAIQIVSRISQEYGIDFPLRDFFARPTIAQQSIRVEEILLAEIEAMTEEEAALIIDRADIDRVDFGLSAQTTTDY